MKRFPMGRVAVSLAFLLVLLLSTPATLGQSGCLNRCLQAFVDCTNDSSPTNCEDDYDACVEVCLLEMK